MTHLKLTDAGRDAAAKLLAELTPATQATAGEPAQGMDHPPGSDPSTREPVPAGNSSGTESATQPGTTPDAPHDAPASD